jgi:pimeloyl-ACP methyl ester carboxylesterase
MRSIFLVFALAFSVCGGETNKPPGSLVEVFGHKMHIDCAGPTNAACTVVFESGGGGSSKDWQKVRAALGPGVRTCAYDRAGLGFSEAGPAPRTMRQEAFELHELLQRSKVTGPIVLVGQSIGGLLARIYTENYGSNVVGIVLVDSTDESSLLGSLRYGGFVRLREKATERAVPEPRTFGKAAEKYNPDDDFLAEEFRDLFERRKKNPQPFGERPLIVISAGRRAKPPGVADEFWADVVREKKEQARDQSLLSRNSLFVVDEGSGHAIHNDNPALVAECVQKVIVASETKGRVR